MTKEEAVEVLYKHYTEKLNKASKDNTIISMQMYQTIVDALSAEYDKVLMGEEV